MLIDTAGTYSEGTKNIVRDIGCRLTEATGEQRETFWFMQRLSFAVQRGNAVSILYSGRERQRYFGSKKSFKKIGRGFSGSGSQLNPTHSSVSEFPLPGVVHLSMDSLHVNI